MNWIKKNFEKNYIIYILFEKVYSGLFLMMRIFPVKKNKIVFCATKGKRYGDNPLYISDELRRRDKKYDIVWLLHRDLTMEIPKGIRRVKYGFFTEIYELATSKVWVDCNTKNSGTLKRKKQLYIQTWHGSYGIKKIGRDLDDKLGRIERRFYINNARITDLMVSNSKKTTEIYRRALWYEGEMLECGSPRNDILFQECNDIIMEVKEYFKINNEKIVLYAPTFRADYKIDEFTLDYSKLVDTLERKYGEKWVILVRLHPNNLDKAEKEIEYDNIIKNASKYSNMQELLVAADILITDYSSCMFDFVTTGKRCFLYATDVEEYKKERDYYFDIRELPFPLAENNKQLEENILGFDEEQYKHKLEELFLRVGLCESGCGSKMVSDYIEKWMEEN